MQLRCQHNGLITLVHKNSQNTQESLCHRKENIMEGYKVFEPDWTCRGFQYEVGKIFEEDVTPSCCNRGFHFCKELKDCFNYYPFNPDNKVAKVIALGEIDEESDDSKCCTNKIQIVEEISWEDVLRMVNLGKGNAGLCNSGNRNSGDRNSGDRNSGDCNSGDWNSGNWNSGNCNSGNCNSGNWNSGNRNSG
ncbi:MAG: pentapeptide repeat-containing protein, partial [Anaerobutyricum soehngenii]